jgi:hypothetical protein
MFPELPTSGKVLTLPRIIALAVAAGLVVLLVLPALQPESRRRHPCLTNLRSLSLAILNYEVAKGHFPPAYVADEQGRPMHSWRVLILPYLDDPIAREIYDQYRFDEPWNGPNNRRLANRMPAVFRCPEEASENPLTTSYVAVVGNDTMWPMSQGRHVRDVKDGTSHTILLVEQAASGIHWMEPRDVSIEGTAVMVPNHPHNHADGVTVVSYADAHTQALAPRDHEIFRALISAAGGEDIDLGAL